MSDSIPQASDLRGVIPQAHQLYEPVFQKGRCGMLAFLASEVAFFGTLIVTYVKFLGANNGELTPAKMLHLPTALLNTVLLISSSFTIAWAGAALRAQRRSAALAWLMITIVLGCTFLGVTGNEWYGLISHGLTLRTNLFGTTYFTLIGFHAGHVTMGILAMCCLLATMSRRQYANELAEPLELTSWYWHFVDVVWVVLLVVVYMIGR
jgi:cytochrome c oxidase subunit 3/cytochrome o ubiquinol oxidase subunit 3